MGSQQEIDRIKKVYQLRKEKIPSSRYSYFTSSHLHIIQGRERELLKILKKYGFCDLEGIKILDIGCGLGNELRNLVQYGAMPERCYGIDLLPEKVETALKLSPNINFICGDASTLPYEDKNFDIILQFTVFTSILHYQMKRNIAEEMKRVLKPDGKIIWYDYRVNNPKNHDVKGISRQEIYDLFSGCQIELKPVTLAPPLVRICAPYSVIVCHILEHIPFLCTHYLGVIKKK